MNNLDKTYQDLLRDILENGTVKEDRTGTGTISVFGRQIRHKMREGFPLLTTKKMAWKSMLIELIWFLRGDTNIKFLVDNGCNIWNGDAYKRYERVWNWDLDEPLPIEKFVERIKTDEDFAKVWGELGPIYGKQWRRWETDIPTTLEERIQWVMEGKTKTPIELENLAITEAAHNPAETPQFKIIDQIQNLIHDLEKNPDSRRLMVNAWNVGELDRMVLPPCHYGFQVYTRKLSNKERYRIWFNQNYETGMEFNPEDAVNVDYENPYYRSTPERAISLMWNQRSVDTFLGLPFNIASYGLLLKILAEVVGMWPDELVGNLGDVHLYSNHVDQAREQMSREPFDLPRVTINTEFWLTESGECGIGPLSTSGFIESLRNPNFAKCLLEDIQLCNYTSHPTIKAPLSN
jgi:thymidylate synthase